MRSRQALPLRHFWAGGHWLKCLAVLGPGILSQARVPARRRQIGQWLSWPRKQGIWKTNLGCSGQLSLALSPVRLPPSLPPSQTWWPSASRAVGLACAEAEGPAGACPPCRCTWPCGLPAHLTLAQSIHDVGHALLSSEGLTSLNPPPSHPPFSVLPGKVVAAPGQVTDHPVSQADQDSVPWCSL